MSGPRFEPPKITAPALEIAVKGIPNRKIFRLRRLARYSGTNSIYEWLSRLLPMVNRIFRGFIPPPPQQLFDVIIRFLGKSENNCSGEIHVAQISR